MDRVAELAAPAPLLFIDVQVVEVALPIPKTGGERGIRETKQIAVVAGKTKCVCLGIIAHENLSGKRLHQ